MLKRQVLAGDDLINSVQRRHVLDVDAEPALSLTAICFVPSSSAALALARALNRRNVQERDRRTLRAHRG
jgi:hypothetical protein